MSQTEKSWETMDSTSAKTTKISAKFVLFVDKQVILNYFIKLTTFFLIELVNSVVCFDLV